MEVKTDLSPTDSAPISERHSTFWFDDGSIIICVEDTAFKVHRSHLARHSEIFADLFNVPQPPDTPNIEGCPIVHLPDRKSDFVDLLKALYNPLCVCVIMTPSCFCNAGFTDISIRSIPTPAWHPGLYSSRASCASAPSILSRSSEENASLL